MRKRSGSVVLFHRNKDFDYKAIYLYLGLCAFRQVCAFQIAYIIQPQFIQF